MKIEEKLETAQVERGVMEVIVGFIVGRDLCLCFIVGFIVCWYAATDATTMHSTVRQCVHIATPCACVTNVSDI